MDIKLRSIDAIHVCCEFAVIHNSELFADGGEGLSFLTSFSMNLSTQHSAGL